MCAKNCEEKTQTQLGIQCSKWEGNTSVGIKYDGGGVVLTGLILFKVLDQ